ncbi:hypothetical protein ABEG63_14935 [Chryseobacterium sp. C39-AII1]|uniref:hypothetical protein n=1 Tax=Chryseobacterium sp. C39-AII1 TaxID=3080332 RepID=UPI003209C000
MRIIECHEEKIHLSGQIQDLGFLLVFDRDQCVAASDNALLPGIQYSNVIGVSFAETMKVLLPSVSFEEIKNKIDDQIFYRYVERIRLYEREYFLSIYRYDGKIYLETELALQEQVQTTRLYYYAKYISAVVTRTTGSR